MRFLIYMAYSDVRPTGTWEVREGPLAEPLRRSWPQASRSPMFGRWLMIYPTSSPTEVLVVYENGFACENQVGIAERGRIDVTIMGARARIVLKGRSRADVVFVDCLGKNNVVHLRRSRVSFGCE